VRQFEGGASRDTDDNKSDPEGCFHPLVIREVAEYMKKHSYLPDGTRRPADNWQHGMPRAVWRKSLERHWLDVRLHDKGHGDKAREPIIEALCAVIFNAQGRLLEELLGRDLQVESKKRKRPSTTKPKLNRPNHAVDCCAQAGACCTCKKQTPPAMELQPDGTLKPFNSAGPIAGLVSHSFGPITDPVRRKIMYKAAKKIVSDSKKRYPGLTRRKK